MDSYELGGLGVGGAEVFDFGVDDDLCSDKLAEVGEQDLPPVVRVGTGVAAAASDLVAFMDIF